MGLFGALAVLGGVAAAVPLMAQPEPARPQPTPRNPDFWPEKKLSSTVGELVVPPGIYTSLVFANAGPNPAKVAFKAPNGEITVLVAAGSTVVLPCGNGWQMGQQGTVTFTEPATSIFASGMTTTGPVAFEAPKKK
jgi:hypothetical protein